MKQGIDAFLDCANVVIKDKYFKDASCSNVTRLLLADLFAKEWCRNICSFPKL